MKTTIYILALVLTFNCAYSQKKKSNSKKKGKSEVATWFFASVGGKYGNSMLMNNYIATTDGLSLNSINPSMGFDADLGVNFPFGVSLMVGYDQTSFNQGYEAYTLKDDFTLTSSGMVFLFRIVSENAAYLEVGPKFNNLSISDVEANPFKSNYTSIAFGVGGNLYWHQNFDISLGARLGYGMNMTNNGISIFGNEKTSVFDAQLRLAFNWHIGYFRQAGCDKHVEFLMF